MHRLELRARIRGLTHGPWVHESLVFSKLLETADPQIINASNTISMKSVYMSIDRKLRSRDTRTWTKYFIPHWEAKNGVIEGDEINCIRQSLDEALTYLQLLELAVQTEYLSVQNIRSIARRELVRLMWPKSVRRFALEYDYFLVMYLANRVGVDLELPSVSPPSTRNGSQLNFALFLDQLRRSYEDQFLTDWLAFLDGFDIDEIETPALEDDIDENDYEPDVRRLLRNIQKDRRSLSPSMYLSDSQRIVLGLRSFVLFLGDFFDSLDDGEIEPYALFYSYWLAKFHGFSLEKRYQSKRQQTRVAGVNTYWLGRVYEQCGTDWSKVVQNHSKLLTLEAGKANHEVEKLSVLRRVNALRRAWSAAKSTIHRSYQMSI